MLGSRSDILVRRATSADADAVADTYRLSWQQAYLSIIPAPHLGNMIRRRGSGWWAHAIRSGDNLFVVESTNRVVGYGTCGYSRSSGTQQGEIYELYVQPDYQGVGLGEFLFEACRYSLDQRRLRGLIVWTLAQNTAASDFYWRRGGRPIKQRYDVIGGKQLEKLAFAWQ